MDGQSHEERKGERDNVAFRSLSGINLPDLFSRYSDLADEAEILFVKKIFLSLSKKVLSMGAGGGDFLLFDQLFLLIINNLNVAFY